MILLAPLAAVVAALVAVSLWDLLRGRGLRRLALRNVVRRPVEAVLVVAGASLGTAIITSAFVVGDTFDASVRDIGRTELGPVDEQVLVQDVADLDRVVAAVDAASLPGTDGVLAAVTAPAAVVAPAPAGGDPRAEPRARVGEVDLAAARDFGGDPAATGLAGAGPTPTEGEAVVHDRLAGDLDLAAGDTIDVHAYGRRLPLEVRTIVPRVGLGGAADVFVAPGTLAALAAGATAGEPPLGAVLVSNTGGMFDGAAGSDAVAAELEARLAGIDAVDVVTAKQDVLDAAAQSGTELRTLFSSLGTFSALVGVLLLVNLFVMLAEERKSELGVMRAVGLRRGRLVRLFGLEGGLYSVAAASLGTVLGIAVGQAVVAATSSIIADDGDLTFVFAVRPASLVAGGMIGLTISLVTVWGTSLRIARLHVIRAIRDLPDPPAARLTLRRAVAATAGVLAGTALAQVGVAGDAGPLVLAGPAVALFSALPLVARLVPRRLAVAGVALLSGVWAVVAADAVPAAFEDSTYDVFVVQGLVLVAAGVALVTQADRVWAWVSDRLAERGGLSARLALAYPLARRGRTGLLLAMFSLVVFTLALLSAISTSDSARAPQLTAEASGGWDLWVDSSPTGPVTAAQIAGVEGVEQVSPMVSGVADLTTTAEPEPTASTVTGIEPSMLDRGAPALSDRDDRFASDQDAFAVVAAGPGVAITTDDLLQGDGPTGDAAVAVGDTVTVTDPVSGERVPLEIVGVTDEDWASHGLLTARSTVEDVLGARATGSRHLVAVDGGADAESVAHRITAAHVTSGADARTFAGEVASEMGETRAFMRLLQGYLGLGLVIGTAGLGVVMVRAVRERRRQVGVLRALGFPARVVRRAFLLEAGFVALQGILIGLALGLVTAWQILDSHAFGEPIPLRVPWLELVVLVAAPALAAAGAAVTPAAQAARIRPPAALRTAD